MKPSSLCRVLIALSFLFCSASFITRPSMLQAAAGTRAAAWDTHFYWYLTDGDTYDAYNTIADEITRLEAAYDVYVDTSPVLGTQIASGYSNNSYPHTIWASSILYAH